MRNLTSEEKLKMVHVINEGMKVLQDITDLKEGLKDTVSSVAEELEIKPTIINKAIKTAFKKNLNEQQNSLSEVEDLLTVAGIKV